MGKSIASRSGKILALYLALERLTVEHYVQFWPPQNKEDVNLWRPNEVAKGL